MASWTFGEHSWRSSYLRPPSRPPAYYAFILICLQEGCTTFHQGMFTHIQHCILLLSLLQPPPHKKTPNLGEVCCTKFGGLLCKSAKSASIVVRSQPQTSIFLKCPYRSEKVGWECSWQGQVDVGMQIVCLMRRESNYGKSSSQRVTNEQRMNKCFITASGKNHLPFYNKQQAS